MTDSNSSPTKSPTPKPVTRKRAKGPLRTEAVVPFLLVVIVVWAYFHFLFDHNLKNLLEYAGYQVVGAEVDIANLETSFWKATFRARGIEITNSERPSHNIIRIGDIRYGLLWDGLLRARFVVNEMAVEQIEFNTARKHPGKVKPPEPPKPVSNEPSALEKEAEKLKNKALEKTKQQYSDNVLGDIAAMLGGTNANDQMKNIEGSLPSKAKLQEFEKDFKAKQLKWQERMKTLPQGSEIQALGDRLSKVKTKDFSSPQDLQTSLQQIDAIFKEADAKIKLVQTTQQDLNQDLKTTESNIKELDSLVKKDIADLQARFKIPKLDAKSISRSLFFQYLNPYMAMFNKYKGLAEKYMPPKLLKKDKSAAESEIKAHPRASGVVYEFGHPRAYPLFWVKRISVSSQAGATKESGNIKGLVTDITSNQHLIGKPTVAHFEGNFPGMEVQGLVAHLSLDTTKEQSRVDYNFGVDSYAIDGKDLVNSPDAHIAFRKATGALKSKGSLVGLTDFSFSLDNKVQKIDYDVSAKNDVVDSILKEVFKGIPVVTIEAAGRGELPGLDYDLQSNLGPELQKGFEKQLQKKIDEAKQKLQATIDEVIGKQKAQFEGEYNKLKNQLESEIKKISDQINSQKSQANAKVEQSKKDAENQAKKALGKEGQKTLDDLKKKLGF